MDHDLIERVLRDYCALRQYDTRPELRALHTAILVEDLFDVTLSDADIDPAVLVDPAGLSALVARLERAI